MWKKHPPTSAFGNHPEKHCGRQLRSPKVWYLECYSLLTVATILLDMCLPSYLEVGSKYTADNYY